MYLFFAFLLVSFIFSAECESKPFSNRYNFENILNIQYTPSYTSCSTWFTDQGSWMGFTIPQTSNWINGFCGPFDLDGRIWMASSLTDVAFDSFSDTFKPDSISYFPGEAYLSSYSSRGKITQRLMFIDKNSALLVCESDGVIPLCFTNQKTMSGTKLTLENNSCVLQLNSKAKLVVTFVPETRIIITGSKYKAVTPLSKKTYVVISYFYDSKYEESGLQKAIDIVSNPDKYMVEHDVRWEGYLKSILRDDLPKAYDRIAVKSIVTLLSNWRSSKGDLLHDGVVPSHAVDYFIGFWGWDSWKHAVALASFAPELAKNQVRAMFDYQTDEGMIIDCIYTNKSENNERDSKPPLAAWAVHQIYKTTGDISFVKEMYPKLLKYYQWWYKYRDNNHNGICEFGSVDGTEEAAAWESGMDNAIRFDNATMVKNDVGAWSFNQESVDLNAYLAFEYIQLKELALVAQQPFDEKDRTEQIANYFFDNEKGFFFDKRLTDGTFIREEGCEAYIPFWAGISTQNQADRANEYFTNPSKFATYIPFPTVAADNPKFTSNGYWRGPIWLDQVYFGIKGLRNYGYNNVADEYTQRVFDRLKGLKDSAPIHENYDTHTGGRLKSPNFSWSAAHLLMMYKECGKIDDNVKNYCSFETEYRKFAYIKSVDISDIKQKTNYSEVSFSDYSNSQIGSLLKNKIYTLKVVVSNWDSGVSDKYKVRVWVDWNNDYILDRDELVDTQLIDKIGDAGQEHTLNFKIITPNNAAIGKKLRMRVFLHYVEYDTDGETPCGKVDSGEAQDYSLYIEPPTTDIGKSAMEESLVYPNPTSGELNINSTFWGNKFRLYSLDGKMMEEGICPRRMDVSHFSSGVYILKVSTPKENRKCKVIVKK